MFSKVGNGYGLARAHDSLARVYLELGELERSQDHMERATLLLADLTVGEAGIACEMWQSGAW